MLVSSTFPCLLESDLFALTFTVHGGVSAKRKRFKISFEDEETQKRRTRIHRKVAKTAKTRNGHIYER